MSLNEELVEYARVDDLEGIRVALRAGVDVHFRDNYALYVACFHNHVGALKLLLEAGADVHSNNDQTLRCASYYGYVGIVEVLLKAGADVHASDEYALCWASDNGHIGVVIKLVEAGADLWVLRERWVDLFGCSAPSGLIEMGISRVVELMVSETVAGQLI